MRVYLDQNCGVRYRFSNRQLACQNLHNFALWVDGICYGIYTRQRDAMRRYRQLLRQWVYDKGFCIVPDKIIFAAKMLRSPSWIESTSGQVIKILSGYGFTTKAMQTGGYVQILGFDKKGN